MIEAASIIQVLAVVEAKHLLVKVTEQMKRLHANIGSRNPAFQQRPEILQRVSVYAAIYILRSVIYNLVSVISRQTLVGLEGIGVQGRTCLDMLANLSLQRSTAAIRNDSSSNLSTTFHDAHDCGFVLSAISGDAALPLAQVDIPCFAADESLINFDFAAVRSKFAAEEAVLQSESDAVEHEPCRLLSNLQIAGDFVAADSVLAVDDQPNRGEPLVQSDCGIFHHTSDLDGELPFRVMSGTLPSSPIRVVLHLVRAASRTDDAFGPSADSEIVNAVVRVREI